MMSKYLTLQCLGIFALSEQVKSRCSASLMCVKHYLIQMQEKLYENILT